MLTDPGDFVLDPFGGRCITGEVAERLGRKWACAETVGEYLDSAIGRFKNPAAERAIPKNDDGYYKIPRPSLLWNGHDPLPLAADGGKKRPASKVKSQLKAVNEASSLDVEPYCGAMLSREY